MITDVQRHLRHAAIPWMGATIDGRVQGSDAVFEAKFMATAVVKKGSTS